MPFPERSRIETAILQELKDLRGDDLSSLMGRLARYFPQLEPEDLRARTQRGRNQWRLRVQRARQALVKSGELQASDGGWQLTEQGRLRAKTEDIPIQLVFPLNRRTEPSWGHEQLKRMLLEVGRLLGKHAQEEYQRYDVVWRDSEASPRLSHVFEVQVAGKVESALAKLKHAYDTQRSRPFLVVAYQRDARRVREMLQPYLSGSFHEIGQVTTVLSPEEVYRLYRALTSVSELLVNLTE